MEQEEGRPKRLVVAVRLLPLVGGAVATVASLILTFTYGDTRPEAEALRHLRATQDMLESQLADLRVDLATSREMAKHLEVMLTALEEPSGAPPQQFAPMKAALDDVTRRVGSFDRRLIQIEEVILASPEKALQLPMLKRDIQGLEDRTDQRLIAAKGDNDRTYDLMKWLIGLMAVISLSLVGTAAGNLFKRDPAR